MAPHNSEAINALLAARPILLCSTSFWLQRDSYSARYSSSVLISFRVFILHRSAAGNQEKCKER